MRLNAPRVGNENGWSFLLDTPGLGLPAFEAGSDPKPGDLQ
jgi:hypothetical protein